MPYDPFTGSWYDDDRSSSIGTGTYRYNPFDDPVSTQDDLLGALRSSYETASVPSSGLSIPEPEPPSFFDNLSRLGSSAASGFVGAAGNLIGAAEGLSRMLPLSGPMGTTVASDLIADEIAPTLQPGRYAADLLSQQLRPEREEDLFKDLAARPIMGTLERGAEMATPMASMIGVGAVAGPAAGAAAGGLFEFGGAFGENVDAGVDPERAAMTSAARAAAVAALDRIGLSAILGRTGAAAVEEVAPLLVQAGRAALTEGSTEIGQEAIGMAEEAINGRVPTWDEISNRLATAGMFGALFGGGAAATLGMGGSAAQAPPGAAIPPEAMAPAAPPVDPMLEMTATAAAMPQDIPTQQVPMAGDVSTQLLPQAPFDPTSQIPPEMLNDPTMAAPEAQIPTQQMTGPLPTEPSLQRTQVAPQEIPVEQYVPEAVRRDIEEARALLAQQKEQARRMGERDPSIAKSPTPRPGRGVLGGPDRAKVQELIPQLVEQDARNRRIEQAMDETTDGRAPVEQAPAAAPVPAPFPPPRKAPAPKVAPPPAAPLEATVDERVPKTPPPVEAEPVPAEALGALPSAGDFQRGISDPGLWKRMVKKYGTSLGALSKPARMAIEAAKGSRSAVKAEAVSLANALTRLEIKHQKSGQYKRVELDRAVGSYLEGETPEIELPADVRAVADRMREIIMPLQRRQAAVLRAQGRPELAKTFQSNVGKRLTRSYKVFDDPKHVEKLRRTGEWDYLKKEISALPEMKGKTADEVEVFMEEMTDRDPLSIDLKRGKGLGTAYEGIYQQRQEIPAPVRQLLGEYTESGERFYRTADRLARNISTYEMYSDLKKIGMDEGWISEKAKPGVFKEIPGKGTRNPIGGMRTTPEMYDVIAASDPELYKNPILRGLQWATGAVKANKTMLSVQSTLRNFIGNGTLHAANGNLVLAKQMPWNRRKGAEPIGLLRAVRDFHTTSGRAEAKGAEQGKNLATLRTRLNDMAKYGLIDSVPDVEDINYFFGDPGVMPLGQRATSRLLSEVRRGAQGLYQGGDVVYKDDAWANEQNRLAWIHDGDKKWTKERIKAVAADHVKDTYPTSDRQPEAVRILRRQPVFGGLISFIADIPRNAKNITKRAVEEISEGKRTGNQKLVISGTQRLTALIGTVAGVEAMWMGIRAARGAASEEKEKPTRDEELMFRPFLPSYLHNARTPVVQRGKGYAVLFDSSFMDAWATLKKPITAAFRSLKYDEAGFDRATWEAFKEMAGPYYQSGMFIGPLYEARTGVQADGRKIWDKNDSDSEKIRKSLNHLAKRYEPGTATTIKRIGSAVASGDLKRAGTEALAVVGPRLIFVDMEKDLPGVGYGYGDGSRAATATFRRALRPEASDNERVQARRAALDIYEASARNLTYAIKTARKLQLSPREIEDLLNKGGVSRESIKLAFRGESYLIDAYKKKLAEDFAKFKKNPRGWRDD